MARQPLGETPKTAAVLKEEHSVDEAELIAHTREVVGSVKKIISIDFIDTLPRTSTGEIERGKLREPYWRGRDTKFTGSRGMTPHSTSGGG